MRSPVVRAAIACAGFFLITLDASVVNVALPAIGRHLHADLTGLQWVVDGYTVALAGCVVVSGVCADRFGSARVMRWGLVGFGVASLACAAASRIDVLIAARVVQGVAGAAVLPSSMAVAAGAFTDPAARQKALGWWAAGGGVAVAAGPVLGGVLADSVGWPAIFLINLPVTAIGALAITSSSRVADPAVRAWDPGGQLELAVCLAAGVCLVVEAGHRALTSTSVAVVLLAITVPLLMRRAKRGSPALPVRQLRRRGVLLAVLTGAALNVTFFGVVFAVNLTLQQQVRLSAATTGLALLPAAVIIIIANLTARHMISRFGAYHTLAFGLVAEATGFILVGAIAIADVTPLGWYTAAALIPTGIGAGTASPAMMSVLVADTDPDHTGQLAGFLNGARQAGTALGVALAGTTLIVAGQQLGTGVFSVVAGIILLLNAFAAWATSRYQHIVSSERGAPRRVSGIAGNRECSKADGIPRDSHARTNSGVCNSHE